MKFCIVGSGSIGKRHIRNIYSLGKEKKETVIIDLLRSSKSELPQDILDIINKQYYDISDLPPKYDAIIIANPTSLHYTTIKQIFDYSDNFFVEKPVFDKTDFDFSDIEISGKKFYVACPLRYTKVLLEAKKVIENCQTFSVRAISSSYLPDWRPGTDYRKTYSAHKNMGGGVLIDLIHEWDYLSYFFGFPEQIEKLYGKYSNLEIDSEDLAIYIARYNDKLLELHLDYCGRETQRYCEIITSDSTYRFDITNSRVIKNGIEIAKYNEQPNDKYMEEMKFFYDIINGIKENTNDINHAVNVMKIALA